MSIDAFDSIFFSLLKDFKLLLLKLNQKITEYKTFSQLFSDRIEEADADVQTDAFLDRPPSPLFIPQTTGKDMSTQIEPGDVNFYYSFFSKFNR